MTTNVLPKNREYEPTWDIVKLFPAQGQWSEEEYLALETNRLVEFSQGTIEVLPMPSQTHQFIVYYLHHLLFVFITEHKLGRVLGAPFRIKLWSGKYREPDVAVMLKANDSFRQEQFWEGADLVVEVVSPDDPNRDFIVKRQEYEQTGIPEYWIVDSRVERIIVLTLEDDHYVEFGEFTLGQKAFSPLLTGFEVDVTAVFAAGMQ